MLPFLIFVVVVENSDKQGSSGKSDQIVSTVTSGGVHVSIAETESSKDNKQELSTGGNSEFSDLNEHKILSADLYKSKSKNNADVAQNFTWTSKDGISSLTDNTREPVSAESNNNSASIMHSYETLSEDNLSVDARACAYPKKKPKGVKLLTDKLADEEKLDFVYEKEKQHFECSEEPTKEKCEDDIENFIRNLVQKQFSCRPVIKFFDAAIVYDKRDYEEVINFRDQALYLVKSRLQKDLRIELFDSEEFAQSKIMVVEDVIEKCSVVLVYLSTNFTSPELLLFVEEAIGLSRLGYNSPSQTGQMNSQRQWVLKPVHTKPRKLRDYKTPVGLLTVNGIDWYDRNSEHTMSQILKTMQVAMTQRKQRDSEVNTKTAYVDNFGSLPNKPHLGPPFNKPHRVPDVSVAQTNEQTRNPLLSFPSNDAMSFSQGYAISPAYQSNYSTVRVDTQPSFSADAQSFPYHENRPNRISSHTQDDKTAWLYNNPDSQFISVPRNSYDEHLPWNGQQQDSGYVDQILRRRTFESQQSFPGPQTRYPPDTVNYNRTNRLENQQDQLAMQSNSHSMTMQGTEENGYLPVTYVRQPRMNVRPPNIQGSPYQPYQEGGPYHPYQTQYMSQDALQSSCSSHLPDDERQLSTEMSVVSSVTGKLIVKSNLSTDDDIEIDTSKSDQAASSKQTKTDRSRKMWQDSEDDSEESVSSSDYDSDEDDVSEKKLIKKVVNIVGCKTVQLGKGNKIKENTSKHVTRDKNAQTFTSSVERKHTAEKANNDIQSKLPHVDSFTSENSALNISVSEDNMSMEKSFSLDDHCSLNGRHLSENINRLSYVEDRKQNIQEKELTVSEPGDNSNIYHRTGADNMQRPKLQTSTYRQHVNESSQIGSVSFSPDDNISESQLFGFGTEDSVNVSSNSSCRSQDAPFSFSQLAHKPDFKRMLHVGLNNENFQMLDKANCEDCDLD